MMTLLLQSGINILFIVVAYGFLSYKRRLERLEGELEQLKIQVRQKNAVALPVVSIQGQDDIQKEPEVFGHTAFQSTLPGTVALPVPASVMAQNSVPTAPIFQAAVPATAAVSSTLVEKPNKTVVQQRRKTLRDTDPAAAFEKAEELLRRGLKAQEVSRLTGLSLSELSLMGKVGRRVQ
jgi:hypothetical protein